MLRFHTLRRVRGSRDLRRLDMVAAFHRAEFPSGAKYMASIRERLLRPLKVDYSVTLVTAEEAHDESVAGFAVYDHFPDLGLTYLEYIVTAPRQRGMGVGGALYEAMRESLLVDGSEGLLFEVNADDPDLPPEERAGNAATLRFYERYDARPLEGVRFDYPPFTAERPRLLLVHDDLGTGRAVTGEQLRAFMRRLYRVKYNVDPGDPGARRVLASVPQGPVPRRPPRHRPRAEPVPVRPGEHLVMVEAIVSEAHQAHKVRERDYLERPLRVERILAALRSMPFVVQRPPRAFPERHLLEVHDKGMVRYLRDASARLADGQTIYPTVFPVRRRLPAPRGDPTHAGYYSLDAFTPLTNRAYPAARAAVDVALTAAERLRSGVPDGPVYAVTRPPGHHAERDLFGGFCYFNNAAVAAQYLSHHGRVALLDVDFHHGNGAQQVFWERGDVLTVSIHGDPRSSYPYFTGFPEERGAGEGEGANLNVPLPDGTGDDAYLAALRKACRRVREHDPAFLVVAFGLDASRDDPSGSFSVTRKGFEGMGRELASLGVPTMLTQEGGYNLRHLAGNVTSFLRGWVA